VVVIDVDRPDGTMPAAVHELRARLPRLPIVTLVTARPTTMLRDLLEMGVVGVVAKKSPASRLVEAVRSAATGELMVDAELAMAAVTAVPNPLTTRESEILQLAAAGATGTEIAARLRLAQGTVRNYLSSAFAKTGARNRIDAVRIALNAGWLQQPPSRRLPSSTGTRLPARPPVSSR
jgi:two-component system response regulator DesR